MLPKNKVKTLNEVNTIKGKMNLTMMVLHQVMPKDQVHDTEQAQDQEQAQDDVEDDQDDDPQMHIEELLERRAAKVASKLKNQQHVMENVPGSLRKGVTTHRQLSNFCEHHAFVSCVEP